jgi:hypothetical protein
MFRFDESPRDTEKSDVGVVLNLGVTADLLNESRNGIFLML